MTTPSLEPLLELRAVTVLRDSVVALCDLSLRIDEGQHTVILGANGSGKSTLVKLIDRQLYPVASEGDPPVRVLGRATWDVSHLRRQLGVVSADVQAAMASIVGLSAQDAVAAACLGSQTLPRQHTSDYEGAHAALARVGCCRWHGDRCPACPPDSCVAC